jgi:hypothetical protein
MGRDLTMPFMPTSHRPFPLIPFLALAAPSAALAVDFEREVKPILESRCYSCHGEKTQKASVAFHTYHTSHQPTDGGRPLWLAGKPDASLIIEKVTATDPKHRMPKGKAPLTTAQIATLRSWIQEGASWPDDGWRPTVHWAYVAPKLPALPAKATASRAIDALVDARLAQEGVKPNPPAPPRQLVRRLFLDVIGLPPTPTEVEAFAAAPTDAAYAKLVDDLLARPQFGEKWARHWLDLARYADSDGFQRDGFRQIWLFRDWVVNALNADMPFDQFTIEQIAGDLLPNPTEAQLTATGFHRNTPLNLEAGTDPEEDRVKQLVDRVNTTGTVWLGTSIGCAQCHNHKYDPFSIREYYQLLSFFNQTPAESQQATNGARMTYVGADLAIGASPEAAERAKVSEAETLKIAKRYEDAVQARWKELEADPVKVAALKPGQRDLIETPVQDRELETCEKVHKSIFKGDRALAQIQKELQRARKDSAAIAVTRTAVMKEGAMRETNVMQRGDFLSPGVKVQAATPAVLHPFPQDAPRNRLGLAQWLVDSRNPLVARVTLNRWWAELFGQPLVSTMEDFGKQGDKPTHPELLDWLATTFMHADDWSMKRTLRRILLSDTYRRAGTLRPDLIERDPQNKLLARNGGIRLDAEAIRDNALAISGLLSVKMGGPPVKPVQPPNVWRVTGEVNNNYATSPGDDAYRRGLYTLWRRHAHYPSFANFDAPNRAACTVQRTRSNTPLQALTLLNDPAYVEMATALAKRMTDHQGYDIRARLAHGFRLAVSREPSQSELDTLVTTFEQGTQSTKKESDGWFDAASVILNLHETITRP